MISTDCHSLECDLLETYGIMNMYELPMYRVAIFSYGLRENSRIKMKIAEQKADVNTLILSLIFDRLGKMAGSDNINSLFDAINGINDESEEHYETVEGEEEWEREYNRRIEAIRRQEL